MESAQERAASEAQRRVLLRQQEAFQPPALRERPLGLQKPGSQKLE